MQSLSKLRYNFLGALAPLIKATFDVAHIPDTTMLSRNMLWLDFFSFLVGRIHDLRSRSYCDYLLLLGESFVLSHCELVIHFADLIFEALVLLHQRMKVLVKFLQVLLTRRDSTVRGWSRALICLWHMVMIVLHFRCVLGRAAPGLENGKLT